MPAIAGISGGRTSARMAYMLDPSVVLCFQNTGREHSKTYDFIEALEQDLQRPIVRLEFRAPARGEPPAMATFEIVEHRRLHRGREIWLDVLECMKAYRAQHKGLGPTSFWVRSRTCTAYMKVRTQRKFCLSLGWGSHREYTEFVGLRADEPIRVAKMRARNDARNTDEQAPLADAGEFKRDVLSFWAAKPFDLGLTEKEEHLGNCIECFQKDEADLATALLSPEADPEMCFYIESNFGPMRRGRSSYRQVFDEAPSRMEIRASLERGDVLIPITNLSPRRRKLIIAQEFDRLTHGPTPWSCECDAVKDDDDDLEAA